MVRSVGQLIFTIEPEMSDCELDAIVRDCDAANKTLDAFLAGNLSDSDFCDLLASYSVDVDEYANVVNDNLNYLGFG